MRNPHAEAALARIVPVVPAGWRAEPAVLERMLTPGEEAVLAYDVLVGGAFSRRERLAVDVTIGSLRLGQHTEALLTVDAVSLPSRDRRA